MGWRLLELSCHDCYTNMAIDEAIMSMAAEGLSPNTIRFYTWSPSAVSIGYFQSILDEVDLEACERLGIDIIRRITGGGAVYHDRDGEITYSLVVRGDEPVIPGTIAESYSAICGGVIGALSRLGLGAEFEPVNDVLVGGRKISGSAQARRMGVVLQHGTVLVDLDVHRMFSILSVASEKMRDKLVKTAEERVTSVRRELGPRVSFEEVHEALVEGFSEKLGVELEPGELLESELELVESLKEKYSSRSWIFRR